MNKTKIDYCDSTWNPITGCLHGCEYCYARGIVRRFAGHLFGDIGITNTQYKDSSNMHILENPALKFSKRVLPSGQPVIVPAPYPFGFDPTFHHYLLDKPKQWKKPRTIFVGSMCDLFGDWVPDEWVAEVFEACEAAPQHRYLFLTKNPERYIDLYQKGILKPRMDNFWFGTTVTAGEEKVGDSIWHNIFVSIEPLHAPIIIDREKSSFDWVIIGAETGNRKNKIIPKREWIESIVEQCRSANIPVFMKRGEKIGKDENGKPLYFLKELMGDNFIQEFPWPDAKFIAHARLDIPNLLDSLETAEKKLIDVEAQLQHAGEVLEIFKNEIDHLKACADIEADNCAMWKNRYEAFENAVRQYIRKEGTSNNFACLTCVNSGSDTLGCTGCRKADASRWQFDESWFAARGK